MNLILLLIVGLLAGWLAIRVMKPKSKGILFTLVVGIIGALLGGRLLGIFGLASYNLLGQLISAFVGAVVLLYLVRLVKKI